MTAYFAGINGSQENDPGVWHVPCGTTMPDLSFSTSAGSSIIPGAAFLTETNPVSLDGSALTVNTDSKRYLSFASGSCFILIFVTVCATRLGVAWDGPGSIGTPFFATHYVIFNQQELSISFALQA